ncbi:hypothetical protein ACP4OV_003564 [Aristida adscensionis]
MDDGARGMMELKTLSTRALEKKGVPAKIRTKGCGAVLDSPLCIKTYNERMDDHALDALQAYIEAEVEKSLQAERERMEQEFQRRHEAECLRLEQVLAYIQSVAVAMGHSPPQFLFAPPPAAATETLTTACTSEWLKEATSAMPTIQPGPPFLIQSYCALPTPRTCVGGNAASLILKLLRQGGTMVTYGGMSKRPVTVPASYFIFKGSFPLRILATEVDELRKVRRLQNSDRLSLGPGARRQTSIRFTPFSEFNLALEKAMGKHGSKPKQVLRCW